MMDKKGVSPLIATVLLIGFTIVLAAVVIRWGGDFITKTTETTTCEADLATACATQVDYEVVSAILNANGIGNTIKLQNNGDYQIESFTILLTQNGETKETITDYTPIASLGAFETATLTFGTGALSEVYDVEVIPTIAVEDCDDGACGDNREVLTGVTVTP